MIFNRDELQYISLILIKENQIDSSLTSAHFTHPTLSKYFSALSEIAQKQNENFSEKLIETFPDETETIAQIISDSVITDSESNLCKKLKSKYNRRLLASSLESAKFQLLDGVDSTPILYEVQNTIDNFNKNTISKINYRDDILQILELEKLKPDTNLYLNKRYGLNEICLYRGLLNTIGAYTGIGKTTFLLNLILDTIEQKNHVLFFSLEMSKVQIYNKLIGLYLKRKSGVSYNYRDVLKFLTELDLTEFVKKIETYLTIVDERRICTKEIIALSRQYIAHKKTTPIICIDYLQIIQTEESKFTQDIRISVIRNITDLSDYAKKNDIVLIGLAQSNRESQKTTSTKNMFDIELDSSSLQESSILEQESGLVLTLNRFTHAGQTLPYIVLNVAKNRFNNKCKSILSIDNKTGNIEGLLSEIEKIELYDLVNPSAVDKKPPEKNTQKTDSRTRLGL